MSEIYFRCSSIGKLMTEPRTKSEGPLSVGAKTYVRELAKQDIFGVEFEISSKYTEKGIEVEGESIALLNRVRGLSLAKNTERRVKGLLTGECDLFDVARNRGHDIKSSWSTATFPGWEADCVDKLYEWQMRGYMHLWDASEWEVNYTMVDTPERLISFEPLGMHLVSHIPEHLRLTSWAIKRDKGLEQRMLEKLEHAKAYYLQIIEEFDINHQPLKEAA
ncbi:hypothetical protein [Allopusillimonas ginsengisoli]|uniref:hypothetical protein n=1 Tax=Allopusillimonas ginsengisoli TaxID=453575 RepID=UPI0010225419|nr:hypothetical protein [Allopusillimonas ginsengisoli]TEA78675.1 hypothetical protein ERE07_09785 [Allopusillimonas ginsengisoli]